MIQYRYLWLLPLNNTKIIKEFSGEEAARILDENGILDHLAEYYDVLHTQSAQWLVKEMDDIILVKNHETDLIPQR